MRKFAELRSIRIAAIGLLSFLVSGVAKAQDSIRINLEQALEIALSDNPTVKVADNTIELKKFAKYESIGALLPNISLNGSFTDNLKLQKMKLDFSPEPISMGQQYTITGNVNLSLPLVAPQLWKTVQLSEEELKLSLEQARSSKIDMISSVKNAYYSLLLAQDAYKTLLSGYNNAALNAKTVTDKYNQGLVSEYDKLVADVQLRNQKPQVVNGENAVRLAKLQLKVLMGIDVNAPIIFEGDLADYEAEMFADLMKLQSDTSLVDNSTLKQFDIQERQLKLAKKINLLGYAPTLSLSLNYGYQGMDKTLHLKDYYWSAGSALGLTLSIPIFSGGQKYFKNKQNNISLLNLQLQRENTERQLALSVTNSLDNIQTAVE